MNVKSGINRTAATLSLAIVGIRAFARLFDIIDDHSRNLAEEIIFNTLAWGALFMAFRAVGSLVLWTVKGFRE